jgi:autotransporter-associated beta strand protein
MLTGVALLCAATVAQAANGTWNGTANALWTNSVNWSAAPYPSGGDTATFNNAGGVSTALDIAGLSGILNITFDTASAAAYTIGAGAANSQTLVMGNNGTYRMNSSVANGQTFNAAVQLGTSGDAGYTLLNDSAQPLTFNNVVATANTKTLNINGSGNIAINGNLARGGGNINVILNNTGALTLSGANSQINSLQINGAGAVINLAAGSKTTFNNGGAGNLMSAQNCTINGPGGIALSTTGGEGGYADNASETGTTLTINAPLLVSGDSGFEYWHNTYRGTIALLGDNSFVGQVLMNQPGTISCTNINNQGVSGNLGKGQKVIHNGVGGSSRLLFTGPSCTTDRIIELRQDGIVEQAGSGSLKFTTQINVTTGTKTLTLQGSTSGTGEFAGAIRNDAGVINLKKEGTGTWTLSAANPYTGSTAINGGKVILSGAAGALSGSSSLTLAAGTELKLDNTDTANNADRLRDAMPVTLSGATLTFANNGGAVNTSETNGTLNVGAGASTIATSEAASGQTATLTLGGLVNAGGTLNFTGAGLGTSDRNRIFITGQPDGLIGSWATVNGTSYAAYSSVNGVYAATTSTSAISARGPSVVTNDASTVVSITTAGTEGPITIEGDPVSSVFVLQQATTTDALVALSNKTLRVSQVQINSGQANLTIGEAQGDGFVSALNVGGALVLANDATSTLTVNAAITNNTSASFLTKKGTGKVLLTGPLSYTGATGLNEGTLAIGGSLTQTLASAISGPGTLSKEGSGRLTLSGANAYTGPTVIKAGVVVPQNNTAFGSVAAGTVVEAGATIDIGSSLGADALNMGTEQFTVSGAGVDGKGVIVNNGAVQHFNAFGKIALAGDATFGGTRRWDIRQNGPALTLNGYTLTKVGSSDVVLVGATVTPGAGSIDVTAGSFNVETDTRLNGSAANTMRVRSGATLAFYQLNNYANTTPWSLILDNLSRVINYSGAANQNVWNGPVSLNGTATLDSNNNNMSFSGAMTNSGSIVKINGGTVYLTGSNNTYTGTSTVNGGVLYTKYPGSLPGYNTGTNLIVNAGGTILLPVFTGSYGWTVDQIRDLHNTNLFATADASLGLETFANLDYPYNFPSPMGLTKTGPGTLNIPDGQSLRSQIKVNGGELVLDNMTVNTTNVACFVGDAAADYGKLTVSNAVWYSILPPSGQFCPILAIGNSGKGLLVVQGNTALTNRFNLGQNGLSQGAVYQQGGNVVNWGGPGYDGRIGQNGYGYYELSSGTLAFKGWTQVGNSPSGVGIFKVSGGTFTQLTDFGGALGISRGGTGVVYVTAGNFNTLQEFWVGDPNESSSNGGLADFTVAGGKATIAGSVKMADRNNMKSVVNLNGGVLEANQIYRAVRTGSQVTVGFNGGTFRARTTGALFGTGTAAPDSVSLYAGGAIFDTTNLDVSVSVPLLAPTGSGVSGISVTPRGGYMGPPFVTLTGGGGTGATAIAQFDSASGFVNGVTVTCPGFGYTSAPTATLSGGSTNSTQTAVTGVSLSANTSGGLTKLGSSLLLLNATNTYVGTTAISNGTLRLGIAAALPANGAINMSGGMLDLGGFSITGGAVNVSGGSIVNGSLYGSSVTKVQNGTLTLVAQLASPVPIVIGAGTMRLQGALPGLYEGVVAGAFDTTASNPNTAVRLTTTKANTTAGWANDTTAIYSGYLWNRATTNQTWTFAENFDDNVLLKIDGNTLIANGVSWNTPTLVNYTMTPGAHLFEARFGQGGGGAGPVNGLATTPTSWWTTTTIGFGYDPLGRGVSETNIANFVALTDTGDGNLLTLTAAISSSNLIDTASTVELAAGATLDLGGMSQTLANLRGSGTVTNGTLGVTGTIAPGGTNVIGTLTIAASSVLTGTLLVDVATDGTSDRLVVQGSVNLSALNLVVANPGQLDRSKQYTLVTCTGTRTGTFASLTGPDSRWKVVYYGDGTVKLVYNSGTVIQLH